MYYSEFLFDNEVYTILYYTIMNLMSPPHLRCCVVLQVCKYFLDAIENNKYGWFWVCPGGGDNCMYRHALPPGFVLKKDKKKEEKEEEISLEELIENEVRTNGAV